MNISKNKKKVIVSPSHGGGNKMNQTVEVSLFNEAWNLGGEGVEGREQREEIISKHYNENKEIIVHEIYTLLSNNLHLQRPSNTCLLWFPIWPQYAS